MFCSYEALAQDGNLLILWTRTVTAKLSLYQLIIVNSSEVYDMMYVGAVLPEL